MLMVGRLQSNFPNCPDITSDRVSAFLHQLRAARLSPHVAAGIIKTAFNGWTTTNRMEQDGRFPCVVCQATDPGDDWRHYAVCSDWHDALDASLECIHPVPPSRALIDTLLPLSQEGLIRMYASFRGYHKLRNEHPSPFWACSQGLEDFESALLPHLRRWVEACVLNL